MKTEIKLRNLENIHAKDQSGQEYFGCDQNWYASEWQKKSGCGPTTAATLLLYLQKSGRINLPVNVLEQKDCMLLMESVWAHVTPTQDGIYLIEHFCSGVQSFAAANGFALNCHSLGITDDAAAKQGMNDAVEFIKKGLTDDCPIAFLNLCNGDVCNLEGWHWVTIVALESDDEYDQITVTIFDGDKSEKIDFKSWYQTTTGGGALVYFETVNPESNT